MTYQQRPEELRIDLSKQRLLIGPDDPLPRFHPRPKAVMVIPIYHDEDVTRDPTLRASEVRSHSRSRGLLRSFTNHSTHRPGNRLRRQYSSYSPPRREHEYSRSRSRNRYPESYQRYPYTSTGAAYYEPTRGRSHSRHRLSNSYYPTQGHEDRARPPNDPLTINPPSYQVQATRPHPTNAGHTPYALPLEIYSGSANSANRGSRARPPSDPLAQNPPDYQIQATQSHGGVSHGLGIYPPTVHGAHYPPTAVYQSTSGGPVGPTSAVGVGAPIIPNIMQHSTSGTNHDALQLAIQEYLRTLPLNPQWCASRCNGRKKAVCIGINYVGQESPLEGCANDARGVRDFLIQRYGFHPQNVLLLTDDDRRNTLPTRKEMFRAFMWLVQGAQKDDSLFFHYSGHGGQSEDASGRESDGMDETIYPVDHKKAGDIIDDELHQALVAQLPPGCRLTALFDSCHSGTVLDLPYLHSAHGRLRNMKHISRRARERGMGPGGDVICFSACKDDETAADTFKGGVAVGAMSHALIRTVKNNPNQTYEELLSHLREILIPQYDQKAQISSSHPLNLNERFTL